jgi:hypothetical protein
VVVSSLLTEAGFESAEKASVETLTEMLQSCEYRKHLAFLESAPTSVTALCVMLERIDNNNKNEHRKVIYSL